MLAGAEDSSAEFQMSWAKDVIAPRHERVGFCLVPGLYSRWFNINHRLLPENLMQLRMHLPAGITRTPLGQNPNCLPIAGPSEAMSDYLLYLRNRSRLQGGTFVPPHLAPVPETPLATPAQGAVAVPAPPSHHEIVATQDNHRPRPAGSLWAALGLSRPASAPAPSSENEGRSIGESGA